jgi:hypothetical protein
MLLIIYIYFTMGAMSHSVTRHLESSDFAVLPFDVSKVTYNPSNPSEIDPNKQYPKEYEEFMTSDGWWNMFGKYHLAYDGMGEIDEAEVAEIIAAR